MQIDSLRFDAALRALELGIRCLRDLPAQAIEFRRGRAFERLNAAVGISVQRLPAWLLSEAPSIADNPAFQLLSRPSALELEALMPFGLRLGSICGSSGGTLPFIVPFLGKKHVVLRAPQGASEEAAFLAALLRVVTTLPPGRVRYLILDAKGSGSGLGGFAPLTASGSIFARADAGKAVAVMGEVLRRNARVFGSDGTPLRSNARGARLPHYWVFAVRGIDRLTSDPALAQELSELTQEAPSLGCAVLASATSNVRIKNSMRFHVDNDGWFAHHPQAPVSLLGDGTFSRDLQVRLDLPLQQDACEALLRSISALNCWSDSTAPQRY